MTRHRRGSRVMKIEGELTIQTAADRRAALLAMIESESGSEPGSELVLDLSGVTELDTAGLQLLLLVQREAAALGGRLTLRAAGPAVADVLAIAHLDSTHLSGLSHSRGEGDLAEVRR